MRLEALPWPTSREKCAGFIGDPTRHYAGDLTNIRATVHIRTFTRITHHGGMSVGVQGARHWQKFPLSYLWNFAPHPFRPQKKQ